MNAKFVAHRSQETEVSIPIGDVTLRGTLAFPENPVGIVLFVHGSGSSRHSPRNRFVAKVLQEDDIATLLFDLLTTDEEIIDQQTSELRFDIELLTKRLIGATAWVLRDERAKDLPIGYFGVSTGAAAALSAAAHLRESVAAVVSRGGRPDLAASELGFVHAPTLLIVGGEDKTVLDLSRLALAKLRCPGKQLVVVPWATHLFEETGALEEVARVAASFFTRFLVPGPKLRALHAS